MRTLILHGRDDLRLDDRPMPHPGAGEVVIEVTTALTCATDAKMLRLGGHPALGSLPAPLGHELCGVVRAIGAGVRSGLLGQRVVAANSAPCGECWACAEGHEHLCEARAYLTGAFAEYVLVPASIVRRNLLQVPSGMLDVQAALVEPLACAVLGAERCTAGPSDWVLVLGGGVQGQLLTSRLAERGCRVALCDPHPERRDRALRFGAEVTFRAPRDPQTIAEIKRSLPGGRGGAYVIEAVGRIDAWKAALEVARPGAEVTFYGGCAREEVLPVPSADLHYGQLRIQGSYHHTPRTVQIAFDTLVSDRYPFTELVSRHELALEEVGAALRAGGEKQVVRPRSEEATRSHNARFG